MKTRKSPDPDIRKKVLLLSLEEGGKISSMAISKRTGRSIGSSSTTLWNCKQRGEMVSAGYGYYELTDKGRAIAIGWASDPLSKEEVTREAIEDLAKQISDRRENVLPEPIDWQREFIKFAYAAIGALRDGAE